MFQRFLNKTPTGEKAVITTDGGGAIALVSESSGISAAAFTTDGTNGSVTVTVRDRGTAYVVVAGAASASAPFAVAQVGTPTATSFVLIVSDLATPTAVDLAAVAARINLYIVG